MQARKDAKAAIARERARQAKKEAYRKWAEETRKKSIIQLRQAVIDILMTHKAQSQYASTRARLQATPGSGGVESECCLRLSRALLDYSMHGCVA